METNDAQPAEPSAEASPPQASAEAAQGNRPETAEPTESSGQAAVRPIVAGIGASAGGLQALQAFFEAMPENIGVAFVVIVHLSPEHRSHLAEILAASTAMPIQQVQGSLSLEGDHIYVIPPDRRLEISDSTVGALPFEEPRGRRAPIDTFFRSLAEQHGDGFAVILSGGGSDGAVGVKAIKEQGGLILVQEPQEAGYDSMPRAAIATGVADLVLPVRELAARLADLARSKRRVGPALNPERPAPLEDDGEQVLARILAHLHARTGHDFAKYKRATVLRRLGRRMQLHRTETLGDYLAFLRHSAEEAQALFNDLLISVTTFFRDPEAFEMLRQKVIARLFETADDRLRIWVPGCATGEDAYSLMILLQEEADQRSLWPNIQLFASDLDETALARAREGRYPTAIEADVSPERLRRFFVQEGDYYRVVKELRDRVIFAAHSLLRDPPFSRLDLISCRNLLIYLDRELQEQVFNLFHYALRPSGYLFLGAAEVAEERYFYPIDKKHQLYQVRAVAAEATSHLPDLLLSPPRHRIFSEPDRARREPSPTPALHQHQTLLEALAPPSVLVDRQRNALHFSKTAGRFLQQPGGPMTADLTQLVRRELQAELRTALYRLFEHNEPSLSPFIPVQFNGTPRRVALLVQSRQEEADGERLALVIFLDGGEVSPTEELPARVSLSGEAEDQLQMELQRTQAQMRTMQEEYEAANDELLAANEELLSLNEEYRATTEELETSKEELQSLNEELETVNTELKHKFDEVSRAHSDLENLIAATEIGTLFLDINLRIHRFTPRLTGLFNVTPNDRGRPIGDFTHHLDYDQLEADARQVLETLTTIERELSSRDGRWYLVRFRPYRTLDYRIDGVIVTFVDITERKRAEEEVQAARDYAEHIVETVHEPLIILSPDLRVQSANPAFYEQFQVEPDQTEGRLIYELGNRQWGIPELRQLLEEVLPENNIFEDYQVTHNFEQIGQRTMLLNGRRLEHAQLILLAIEDITERKRAEAAVAADLKDTQMLRNLSARLISEDDIQVLYEEVMAAAIALTRADAGTVQILAETTQELALLATQGFERNMTEYFHRVDASSNTSYGAALATGQRTFVDFDVPEPDDPDGALKMHLAAGYLSAQSTPLVTRSGRPIGVLSTHWRERRRPTERELRFLDLLARQAADLIERWQTEKTLRRAHDELEERVQERTRELSEAQTQLQQVASRLILAEQEERRRLSRILHDDLQQLLYGIQLTVEGLRDGLEADEREGLLNHAQEAVGWIRDAIRRTRQLTVDLSPPVLQGEGLTDALSWLLTQMRDLHGLRVQVEADQSFPIANEDMRVLLFQIIRELLFNVVKHAGADQARVALWEEAGQLVIEVSDSGRGFDIEAVQAGPGKGFGLFYIRERLGLFGGWLEISSRPGQGTWVTVYSPVKVKKEEDSEQ